MSYQCRLGYENGYEKCVMFQNLLTNPWVSGVLFFLTRPFSNTSVPHWFGEIYSQRAETGR
jgi:hypothetical protein